MHILIIGNGISGITAARYIRKLSDYRITVISDEGDYFFSRTALMYVYMGHLRPQDTQPYEPWFWDKNRIERFKGRVAQVNYATKTVHTTDDSILSYDKLILATGSHPNKFGWPGQDLDGVHGLYHWQDLEAMERHSPGLQRAVIVGGGLIGIEMAEMFHSRHIPVTMLVRENSFWSSILPASESEMVNRHILEHGIDLRLQTELKEILSDENGKCRAIITSTGEEIACGFVGLTVGVSPNIGFLKGGELATNRGILVNEFLETNQPDVYAIGDCAELQQPNPGRRAIEAIWYTGRMMGKTVAQNILGHREIYDPGIWFNSAKFLDIEYQVYGDVRAVLPETQTDIYWEHASGKKSIRLIFDTRTQAIVGFNLMGVRYRHEVCEKWIQSATPVEEVLQNLGLANFDPEFFEQYEADLIQIYNQKTGKSIQLKQKRGLSSVLRFLKPTL